MGVGGRSGRNWRSGGDGHGLMVMVMMMVVVVLGWKATCATNLGLGQHDQPEEREGVGGTGGIRD